MKSSFVGLAVLAVFMLVAANPTAAFAQDATAPAFLEPAVTPRVQTIVEAFAQDAAEYARRTGVDPAEAVQRLRAQEESVAATDRIAAQYADRLAGIAIEHAPMFRIVVLLTGSQPVAARFVRAGGLDVPILFRTGATATRATLADAIVRHRAAIRSVLPPTQGMGVDMRTGELVVLVAGIDDWDRVDAEAELGELTGVPVSVRVGDEQLRDMSVDGGSRLAGVDPRDGRRYVCTTGFVVTDAVRTGIVTAAHCPDALTGYDSAGNGTPLEFVG